MIDWFKRLENKKNLSFIVFDVVNYYASITIELLEKAINCAKQFIDIIDQEIEIILETKKSFLWTQKGDTNFGMMDKQVNKGN